MSNSPKTEHPAPQQLAAFAQRRLTPAETASLQAHLEHCPACRQKLASAESLSDQDTRIPTSEIKSVAATPFAATSHRPGTEVPADLVNHPRYEILQQLGQGGMGAVYKARHTRMNRLVALKVINAQFVGSQQAVERFHREVEAAAKLDHPNIVRAHDADQAGSTHFLVMEFVEGTDVAKYVEKKGPLPVQHACHFIRQAALGLQHAHQRGMVHRDIKPANLMLTAQGVVKIMDFGLARLGRETDSVGALTGENVLMGTADYIAPEQARDAHSADIRADIYSLGCSLFHLLSGKPPYAGGSAVQKITNHLTAMMPIAELPAAVPAELRAVVAKMVEKKRASRFQTPSEVATALAPFLKKAQPAGPSLEQATAVAQPAPVQAEPQRKQRWTLPALIGAGLCALLLVGSLIFLGSRERPLGQRVAPTAPDSTAETLPSRSGPASIAADAPEPTQPEEAPQDAPGAIAADPPKPTQPTISQPPGRRRVTVKKVTRKSVAKGKVESKLETPAPDIKIPLEAQPEASQPTQDGWTNSLGMEFVFIKPGTFLMGSPANELGRNPDETQHRVTFKRGYYLQTTAVTQKQWKAVMGPGNNPSRFKGDGLPVVGVTWDEAKSFCGKLSARDGKPYRLPYEAEWEYAARAGTTTPFWQGETLSTNQANFNDKSPFRVSDPTGIWRAHTTLVKQFNPNPWGLYDMTGNQWQWCEDWHGEYPAEDVDGINTPSHGVDRVLRGGSWFDGPRFCRAAMRLRSRPGQRTINFGFRPAFNPG